uniref:Immunoglobulin V-set domain-containing protein n=1 Tax=Echeneis naucrates TaxID=173247 RepID=A0A665WAY7_ECHNA
ILLLQTCWKGDLLVSGRVGLAGSLSSYVGGEVSIHCSVGRTKDGSLYFCRGVCSRENILIQTDGKGSAITQQGRYSMEVNSEDGVFNLQLSDSGKYWCGVDRLGVDTYISVFLTVKEGKCLFSLLL